MGSREFLSRDSTGWQVPTEAVSAQACGSSPSNRKFIQHRF